MNLLELFFQGGIVMYPILFLSVVSFYILTERFLLIRNRAKRNPELLHMLMDKLSKADVKGARIACDQQTGATARVIGAGIRVIRRPAQEVEQSMESQLNIEIAEMEQQMSYLGLIAGIAPMLGFIGTISGVIRIFYTISVTDDISIGGIAGGLYEKMISSGSGLVVGVIAYTSYHLLHSMIDRFVLHAQKDCNTFLQLLKQSES